MSLIRIFLLLICSIVLHSVRAQVDNVMVYGTVKDMSSAKKLDAVTVTVYKNGAKLVEVATNASGKYEVNLDYGAEFKVMCSKPGYVSKNIAIDTRQVPEEERQGGHGMNIDFTMLLEIPDVDFSILLEPFGKASYATSSGNFEWDMDYTNRMRDAQARLLKEYDDKKKRELGADAEFAKHMAQGDAAMMLSDFKKAVGSFTAALVLKPTDAVAKAKLSDAQMRMEGQDNEKKREEQYAALIKEADGLFLKKDYGNAKGKYDSALALKDEAHPRQRIKECEAILADLAKKAEEERKARELQEKYTAAIAVADAAFKAGNWDQATTKYTDASGLKPDEKYPKDQLALVAQKKAEAEKKAEEDRLAKELQEKYQAAITAADAAFKGSNWDQATARYTEASGLKPEEIYPKDQLTLVAQKKAEAEKMASEEQLAKELQQKYQAAITAADAAFKSGQYEGATASYTEASELKPAEKYPQDQLAAIQKKLGELAQKADDERKANELDEQYRAVLATADAAFQNDQWDDAIARYTEAGGLKPAEKYPKDQLVAVQRKREEMDRKATEDQKAKELQEKYQAAIAAADAAFGNEEWDAATAKYNEAAGLKPTEKYPTDQLAAIVQRRADAEARKKRQELDARYDAIITAADEAFNKADLASARTKYQEALSVKPSEQYPQDRIAEVDTLLAAEALKAKEEKERKELEARYTDLITKADKAYDKEQWSAALNDYKDALTLKPQESHPQERIATIEDNLDSAARAKAEEERLLREEQDRDKRYADLVASADKAFGNKKYEDARTSYAEALGVKPEEIYPQQRLDEIETLLAELAKKAEEERLAAAERARKEEEERMQKASEAELEARYRDIVVKADAAYSAQELEKARERYTEALTVRPDAAHPQERLVAIDAELERQRLARTDAERLAEERRRAEEERLRLEMEEADADRLAADLERQRLEEERRRREQEEADSKRSDEERLRMEREAVKALEERYLATIVSADEAFAAKAYENAKGLFAEALDLKPEELYPRQKIEQIDQLLAALERKRQEEELAAEQARNKVPERPKSNTSLDSRKEQEAEQFMRAAREQEEAQKYERIKQLRADLERDENAKAQAALGRRMQGVEQRTAYQQGDDRLYEGDESRRLRNADELQAYRDALAREEAERIRRAGDVRSGAYEGKLSHEQQKSESDMAWAQLHVQRSQETSTGADRIRREQERMTEQGLGRNQDARDQAIEAARRRSELEAKGQLSVSERARLLEAEKRAQHAREAALVSGSQDNRLQTKSELDRTPRGDQPRAFADYNRSKLAMDYPPGVTEESYTEGNKVIIRRVVVNGNKADEYSKVIAKWGTFYFKNGQSITEAIWSKETEG